MDANHLDARLPSRTHAMRAGDVFESPTAAGRAVYVVLSFFMSGCIEALRVFPDSMRHANRPTKVPSCRVFAHTLSPDKLRRVLELTKLIRERED